jgi:tRNA(Ile)-lysidine synthase
VPGEADTDAGTITAVLVPDSDDLAELLAVCGPWHAFLDAGALGDHLTVRSRRPGDRIRPLGLGGSRKLQDILVDAKVPAKQRDGIAVIENGEHIVWIPGFAIDERSAVQDPSRPAVHLIFRPVQGYPGDTIQRFR